METLKQFWEEEDAGLNIVEILLLLAGVITLAIIFRDAIVGWVKSVLEVLFPDPSSMDNSGA